MRVWSSKLAHLRHFHLDVATVLVAINVFEVDPESTTTPRPLPAITECNPHAQSPVRPNKPECQCLDREGLIAGSCKEMGGCA